MASFPDVVLTAVRVIVASGLWTLGVPLAGTLAAIAALLTFIPNIGPILSVVPAGLLAVAISPMKGLLTVLLFLAVHFLEGNVASVSFFISRSSPYPMTVASAITAVDRNTLPIQDRHPGRLGDELMKRA